MTEPSEHQGDGAVGYGRPPAGSRFVKGRSGNPAGRPRGRHVAPPHDYVLGEEISIKMGGRVKRMTKQEAFLHRLRQLAFNGDVFAGQMLVELKEGDDATEPAVQIEFPRSMHSSDWLNSTLEALQMAQVLNRTLLKPWLVEAALDRLGDQRLTSDQQCAVVLATREPNKVKWPAWWEVQPSHKARLKAWERSKAERVSRYPDGGL